MNNKNNFAIKLSKEKIELLKMQNDDYLSLGFVNPNSNTLSSDLDSLLRQLLALSRGKKFVDVILPDELIIKQSILTNQEISAKEAASVLAKSYELSVEELSIILGPISSNRSQTVVAVTNKCLTETKEFIRSIGFIPQKFFSLKYVPEIPHELTFHTEKNNKKEVIREVFNNQKYKIISAIIFFPFLIYLSIITQSLLFKNDVNDKITENVSSKATLQKSFNNDDLVLNDKVLQIFPPFIETENKSYRNYNKGKSSSTSFKLESINKNKKIILKQEENYILFPKLTKKKENRKFIYDINQKKKKNKRLREKELFEILKKEKINKEKENKWASNTNNIISNQENLISNSKKILKKVSSDFSFFISTLNKPKKISNLNNKVSLIYRDQSLYQKKKLINNLQIKKNTSKISNESFQRLFQSEFSELKYNPSISKITNLKENFSLNYQNYNKSDDVITYKENSSSYDGIKPLKRPKIIAFIRILREPTISSGAVTFSEKPKIRPFSVSEINLSEKKETKILSLTRGPRFPTNASVELNATIPNIFELNRTNLLGTFGTFKSPLALIKLSSGKVIKLKIGDDFEGWRVYAIEKEKIFVTNGTKREILRIPG